MWAKCVSQSNLCPTGALGVANMKKKNNFPSQHLKKDFQCSDDLRKPREGTTKTCALISLA